MRRGWIRELAGWAGALAIALSVVAQMAASPRVELLFRDGDSLVVALVSRSLLEGRAGDWAMSSVLFLPEIGAFAVLSALLPIGVDGVLAAAGVLNLVGLYGAFRLVAGRRRRGAAPVTWALVGTAVFGVLAMTETSSSRNALELASLLLTTTYYSATVLATVAAIGLLRRMLDHGAVRPWPAAALLLLSLVSTLSNPLYAAWAAVPLLFVLAALHLRLRGRDGAPPARVVGVAAAALLGGTALGFLGRIPFAAWIANSGAGYARPSEWPSSLQYYGGLLLDRLAAPGGWPAAVLLAALVVVALTITLRPPAPADAGALFTGITAWLVPALVIVGAIALGTQAARYLQPAVFAPVLALLARSPVLGGSLARRPSAVRVVSSVAACALVVAGAVGIPRLHAATTADDPDLRCVTDWVDRTARIGAGQFWTVRLPLLHLRDTSRLVQVDHRLDRYDWLVDRVGTTAAEVSFLIEDAQSTAWELPLAVEPAQRIDCGRYTILDFAPATLSLGPAHS